VSAWRVAAVDAGLRALAGLAAVEILLALLVNPGGNLPAPLGGAAVTWPLLSCLAPLGLVGVWTHPMATLERTSARGPWSPALLRLAAAAPLVLAATAAVAVAAPPDASPVAGDGFAPWRNAALVSGLALAGAASLPGLIAWLPSAGYVLACAAVGVPHYGEPYRWTLVFRSPRDEAALWIGMAVFAVGLAAALISLRRPRLGQGSQRSPTRVTTNSWV
jgi:hypothetical protein